MVRRHWWGVVGLVTAAGVLVAAPGSAATPVPAAGPVPAGAESSVVGEGPHAVGLVVDTGERVVQVCVRFSESTLTGAEVLRRAGVNPVFAAYGPGLAVCSLCGTGCPGDGSCLTCQEPNYWSYWNAAPGAGGFTYAALGASSTRLRSGAIDGWRWGSGGAPPPFPAFATVCPGVEVAGTPGTPLPTTLATTLATTVVTVAPPTVTTVEPVPPTPSPGVVPGRSTGDPGPSGVPAGTSPAPDRTPAPTTSPAAGPPVDQRPVDAVTATEPAVPQPVAVPVPASSAPVAEGQAAGTSPADGGAAGGSAAATVAGVALLLGALGGVAAVARRRQRV